MDDEPLHARPALPTLLAVVAGVLAAVGSAAGLFAGGLYRDTEAWIREAQATDLVTLVLAVPVLAAALWFGRRSDTRWPLVALGALWYLAYNYAIFAFSVTPNVLSLLYIVVLGTASWSLVLGGMRLPALAAPPEAAYRMPRRVTAGILIAVPALFALLWLGEIMRAGTAPTPSPALAEVGLPTNPIWPLDLAFALPVVAYGGIRLLRADGRAMATVLPALVFLVLIGLAILGVMVFDVAAGGPLELPPFVIVGTVTVVATVLWVLAMLPERREAIAGRG